MSSKGRLLQFTLLVSYHLTHWHKLICMLDLIPSMAVWLHGFPGEQCVIVPSRYQRDWHTIFTCSIYCIQLRVGVTTVDALPLNRGARNYGNTQNAESETKIERRHYCISQSASDNRAMDQNLNGSSVIIFNHLYIFQDDIMLPQDHKSRSL